MTAEVDVSEHSSESSSEPDVESDDAQVEPGSDDEHVGRIAADDDGTDVESGAEARAQRSAGPDGNDPVE